MDRVKKLVKHCIGWLLVKTGIYRRFFNNKAIVVAFHRVEDRLMGDSISCSRSEFENWCRFFKRYFSPCTLTHLISKLDNDQRLDNDLVITFDDGYRDNFETAVPILKSLDLPSCFFVATGFIESETVPWWDADLPFKPEWMSWDNIRKLIDDGFEVGSHTVNHKDLSKIPIDEIRAQLKNSKEILERKLGGNCNLFSYPYGRPDQITPKGRDEVSESGYICCLSCHGGIVRAGDNPYELKRAPVSPWYISPYHFVYEMTRE